MAWLSDLAGKAETLLNKIDKNTAAALSKDKNDLEIHSQLTDVTWTPTRANFPAIDNRLPVKSPNHLVQSIKSSENLCTPSRLLIDREEEFISFLNTPNDTPSKRSLNNPVQNRSSTPSSLVVEHSLDNKDSMSEYSIQSSRSSPVLQHTLVVDVPDNISECEDSIIINDNYPSDIYTENIRLKSEIESLQNELLVANHVEKSIESEQGEIKQKYLKD